MSSSSHPYSLLQPDSPYDVQTAPFPPKYDSLLPFRARPRRLMLLLFAAAFTTIVLLSHLSTFVEYTESYQTMLGPPTPASPQNTVTLNAPPIIQTVTIERPVEPVVLALIMYSEVSAKEGAILLKSAIMYTSRPLHFHIVGDEEAIAYLETRFRLLTHPVHPIKVRFYRLTFQNMMDRVTREGSISTGHSAGIPGLMKLFLHEILPDDVEKAIYVDTDAFFLTDPGLLWDEFSRWGPDTSISIPHHPNFINPEWYNASEICSCIMLLHLSRLRSVRLMDSSIYRADHSGLFPPALAPPTFEALFGPPGPGGYENAALGDQSYWWAIVSNRRDIFNPLPYAWEVSSCLFDMYMTGLGADGITEEEERKAMFHLDGTPYEGKVVLPKLVHFNCLHGVDVYYDWPGWSDPELSLTMRWKPALEYHVGFKWIWLNRGHTESLLDMQVIIDPSFDDQRFAAEHLD